ncbi:hypothetical protein [Aquimonas voraii]|uniref:hypothetical protein n=1 Tax=Aquimonas voraii TaxID=265719 RepID=UPI000B83A71B|nr:hypothetical protein [Aquimonas voraii]
MVVPLLLVAPFAVASEASSESQGWREYARLSLQGDLQQSLGRIDEASGPPQPRADTALLSEAVGRLTLSVQAAFAPAPLASALGGHKPTYAMEAPLTRFAVETSRFSTTSFSPQVQTRIGSTSELRFGLTVASQRFATPGFGEVRASSQWLPQMGMRSSAGATEQSYGQGVHFGFDSDLGERLVVGLNLQSRVDMDAFKTYRGLFSEPGDFDMPARTGLSLGLKPVQGLALHIGAERVFYSEVAAFTTYALPSQLLALLGDGSAPVFAWRDLNVYSARAELADATGGQWGLEVTTRQQPSPTSALFDLALRELYSGNHVAARYQRQVGEDSSFSIGASYAPAQYILGPNPFRNRYREGSQVEVELNWSVAF